MVRGCSVDQTGQDRQAANAVREDMVEDDDQPRPAATGVRHKLGLPKRTIARQSGKKHLRGNPQDGALTARRGTTGHGEVVADSEITIIDPNRPTTPPGNLHQTLTQARHSTDSIGNRLHNQPWLKTLERIQHQDRPNLQRQGPALRGKGHQIVSTYPLKPAEREHRPTLSEIRPTPPMTKTTQGIKRPRSCSKLGVPPAGNALSQRVRNTNDNR